MRLRTKLVLSYIFLIALIVGSFYTYFNHNLQSAMIEESRINLDAQTHLAQLLIVNDANSTQPQKLAESIGVATDARVTLIEEDGTVVGDSDVGGSRLAGVENHLHRPEVQGAIIKGVGTALRYSETLKISMLYSAMRYESRGKVGIVRLALPLEYLTSVRNSLHGIVGGASLVTLFIALLFSYIFSNLTSKPLREMADAAAKIGYGGEKARLAVVSNDEIGILATVLNDMSERIEEQVQRLSSEKQRLDTILSSMGEGVVVTDCDGFITLTNPSFRKLLSISGDVEGKLLAEIVRNPDLLQLYKEVNVVEENRVQNNAFENNGVTREISISPWDMTTIVHLVPLNVNGIKFGDVAVFHDITDLKKAENIRRDFVANVSHELRTPITVIKGYAETLLDDSIENDPTQVKRFVEIIVRHSERLSALLNDILTLSTLESKQAYMELCTIDPAVTIDKACQLLQERMAEKSLTLLNETKIGQYTSVAVDEGRFEQVMVNLLENAIKYTPEGGTIKIFTEDSEKFVKISVADTGIGIPYKDLPRIFERFYRVDEARTRQQGGTGLGLAIVKHIVHLYGGTVSVKSEPGNGSIFSFTLPKV